MTKFEKIFSPTQASQVRDSGFLDIVGVLSPENQTILSDDSSVTAPLVQETKKNVIRSLESFPYGICEVFKADDVMHFSGHKGFLSTNDFLRLLTRFPGLVPHFQKSPLRVSGMVIRRQIMKNIALLDLDLGNASIVRILTPVELAKNISVNSYIELHVELKQNPANLFNKGMDIVAKTHLSTLPSDTQVRKEHLPQSDIRKRFMKRNIDLRGEGKDILLQRSILTEAVQKFFQTYGFTQIESPKIVSTGNNGNITSFGLDYYGKPAYLTVNNFMHHLIALGGGMRAIYELGPVFRQDNSKTSKHLTEFSTLDFNAVGFGSEETIAFSNELLLAIDQHLESAFAEYSKKIPENIRTITYREYFEFLQSQGLDVIPGDTQKIPEIDPEKLKEKFGNIFWITHKPAQLDAFYNAKLPMGTDGADYLVGNNCELYVPGFGTLADGGVRENNAREVEENLEIRKFDAESFQNFLDVYREGVPSFGGVGFGFDRLVAYFLGAGNTRDTKLIYRDVKPVIF